MNSEVRLVNHYEKVAAESSVLYDNSGFMNYGYWDEQTRTPAQASGNLVHHLAQICDNFTGKLLNVACGNGSETAILAEYFHPANITGINLSDQQLLRAAKRSPDSKFIRMNATDLQFDGDSFDTIICIEAAFHFQSREKFLVESMRVLKPGGKLVMADALFRSNHFLDKNLFPSVNNIKNVREFYRLFSKQGFININLTDVTRQTFNAFRAYMLKNMLIRYPLNVIHFIFSRSISLGSYVFITAQKPKNGQS